MTDVRGMGAASSSEQDMEMLSRLVEGDMFLSSPRALTEPLDRLATFIDTEARSLPIIYTAFDGDHQMFCSLMRRRVVAAQGIPANPDSVLGYKETVDFRGTKEAVLLDDLSILRGCDELWVFTDEEASLDCVQRLAEGVLVEMLYFLKRHRRKVKFVSVKALLAGDFERAPVDWRFSYNDTAQALGEDQRSEIQKLANSNLAIDRKLRRVKYYLSDPLDYKYCRFLRALGYEADAAPLVPYLAVRVEDYLPSSFAPGRAIVGWAKLMQLASSCIKMPSLEPDRPESLVVQLLERVWLRRSGAGPTAEGHWSSYRVPKANQMARWAVTQRERATFKLER